MTSITGEKITSIDLKEFFNLIPEDEPLASLFPISTAIRLKERGHEHGVVLQVMGSFEKTYHLYWDNIQQRNTLVEEETITEFGAITIAALLIAKLTDYTLQEFSPRGNGFDYWLRKKESTMFQKAARLEVAGIRKGTQKRSEREISKKLKQTNKSDHLEVPVYAVVVEFSTPLSIIKEK